jgi:hypothetical protein
MGVLPEDEGGSGEKEEGSDEEISKAVRACGRGSGLGGFGFGARLGVESSFYGSRRLQREWAPTENASEAA